MLCDPMEYNPWNSPGHNTGVGSSSLLQGVFPTQGSNPDLPHCRWILYQLSHQEARSCGRMYSNSVTLYQWPGLTHNSQSCCYVYGPCQHHCPLQRLPSFLSLSRHNHPAPALHSWEKTFTSAYQVCWVIPPWDSSSLPLDSRILYKLSNLGRQLLKYS